MSENISENNNSTEEESTNRWTVQRVMILAVVIFVILVLLPFIAGIVFAISDFQNAGEIIRLVRDIFIIVLSMVSILIALALAILVIQVAGLMNLLQTEIKPLLENLTDTANSARGTVKFVGDNVTKPLIRARGFMAGLSVFTREAGGIRRAVRSEKRDAVSTGDRDE